MPARGTRDGYSCGPFPHTLLRCHHGVTTPPCTPLSCYCSVATSPNMSTTPKVASEVNIPSYAQSSHSSEGMAHASLDEDDALEDDFQMPHTLVCRIVQWEDNGHESPAEGRPESSRGSPGQQAEYQVDIGKDGDTLETVDSTWRTTHWLQLAVQGILDDEVPWAECIIPLTMGIEDATMSLAKCLLAIWWWSIKVQGQDIFPSARTALNIGQFMTQEEVWENVDNSLWFEAYSCTLQRVREAVCSRWWQWARGKAPEIGVSATGQGILGRNRCQAHRFLHETLLGTSPEGYIQKEGKGHGITCDHLYG